MATTTVAREVPVTDKDTNVTRPESSDGALVQYDDAETLFQPKSLRFWIIISGMYISLFLVALDRTIVATAIPKITDEFHSIGDIAWYGSAYLLTGAIMFPISGRIYKLWRTKWVYIASVVIFEVGSAICGAAPNSAVFIVGRAISGIGASGIFSGGMMMMIALVPLRKRPIFTAVFSMFFAVASVVGPVVGGAFTVNPHLTWRWCFYINIPFGVFTIVGTFLYFNVDAHDRESLTAMQQFKKLDPLGIFFLVPSMVCLIIGLQWGGIDYAWTSPRIVGLFCSFGVLFALFLAVQVWQPATAMAPPRVICDRSMAAGMFYIFLLSGGLITIIYYITIWFQATKGADAVHAGINTLPLVISIVVSGTVAALGVQKLGYYVPPALFACILCSVGAGMLSTLKYTSSSKYWIGYQVLYGLGAGAGFQMPNLVAQTALPRADVPLGVALVFFMQQLGGAIFLAVSQNIFTNKLVQRLSKYGSFDPKMIVESGATAFQHSDQIPAAYKALILEAFNFSLTRTFLLSAGLSAAMILGAVCVKWVDIRKKKENEHSTDATTAEESELVEKEVKI